MGMTVFAQRNGPALGSVLMTQGTIREDQKEENQKTYVTYILSINSLKMQFNPLAILATTFFAYFKASL